MKHDMYDRSYAKSMIDRLAANKERKIQSSHKFNSKIFFFDCIISRTRHRKVDAEHRMRSTIDYA